MGSRIRMLAVVALAGLGAGLVLRGGSQKRGNLAVPEPARPVELNRYLGKWYELARYDARFERGCEGVTAEYAALPGGRISIRNACHRGGPAGPLRVAHARAWPVPGSQGAKLRVSFFGPFTIGKYWILDHDEDYNWSIVGEPSGRYLWILTREALVSDAERQALYARAAAFGYDRGLLRATKQPPVE